MRNPSLSLLLDQSVGHAFTGRLRSQGNYAGCSLGRSQIGLWLGLRGRREGGLYVAVGKLPVGSFWPYYFGSPPPTRFLPADLLGWRLSPGVPQVTLRPVLLRAHLKGSELPVRSQLSGKEQGPFCLRTVVGG
ncbi:jg6926 [Pararge aegeria aegeria]|uniref:Jg6926 protein n=1 Tax=Pararge aegeria aegeria TaxID=348720 RepID=A0A8S4QXR2_9NEOP|nr:jg6926 [Pararge aegeria aegeria]